MLHLWVWPASSSSSFSLLPRSWFMSKKKKKSHAATTAWWRRMGLPFFWPPENIGVLYMVTKVTLISADPVTLKAVFPAQTLNWKGFSFWALSARGQLGSEIWAGLQESKTKRGGGWRKRAGGKCELSFIFNATAITCAVSGILCQVHQMFFWQKYFSGKISSSLFLTVDENLIWTIS